MRNLSLELQDALRLAVIMGLWGWSLLGGTASLNPLHMSLDILAWLCLFMASVAGISRLQDLPAMRTLHREQQAPPQVLERLHALGSQGEVLASTADADAAARAKLLQAHAKRQLIIERKLARAQRTLRRKRLLQDVATLVAIALLIAARVGV